MVTFQRARSDEQRELRRRAILETAGTMLTEMPVSEVSLNELARRVGLAKSNVLRYFESREEVLLDLLHTELDGWLDELRIELPKVDRAGEASERIERIAATLAATLTGRPVLCDLISAQAAVLERNVSPAVAAACKRRTVVAVRELGSLIRERLPELRDDDTLAFAGATFVTVGGLWPLTQPSTAMLAAYDSDPELAAMRLGFQGTLTQLLATLLAGILARPTG